MATNTCYGCNLTILDSFLQKCAFCPKQFHVGCSLSAMKLQHGIVCNFGCRQAYDAGMAAAQRQRQQHACKECGKTFSKNSNLHAHIRAAHRKERYGPCPCCDPALVFTTKQDLRRHLLLQRRKTAQLLEGVGQEERGVYEYCTAVTAHSNQTAANSSPH